jgi:hypothetical protein
MPSKSPAPATVDDFVSQSVLPQFRPIVEALRQLMREAAPNTRERISYGIPAWRGRRIVAVISPTKKDITFAFSKGAHFDDRYGLLKGVGNTSKHVKLKSLEDVDAEVLRYYIQQALDFDEK